MINSYKLDTIGQNMQFTMKKTGKEFLGSLKEAAFALLALMVIGSILFSLFFGIDTVIGFWATVLGLSDY